ncbi:MAG: sulfurtransferase complex subunit TusB [Alphaproteobacteria bacterium]|nr:sulfurtransferase complex subunit TusB [Alphaproteobacteria bacterium]
MSQLHTVSKSPFERTNLQSCLKLATPGSAILLYEDAVIGAMQGTSMADAVAAAAKTFSLHVLGPDLAARGLDAAKVVPGVKVVDYAGFVDLAAEASAVQAWC